MPPARCPIVARPSWSRMRWTQRRRSRAVAAVGQDRRVLLRDVDLVVEAVRHPAPDLRRRAAAAVQPHVERVVDVVARLPGAQRASTLELGAASQGAAVAVVRCSQLRSPCRRRRPRCHGASSSARSASPRRRIGLVLLMWMRILRARRQRVQPSSMPPGPLCGRWPMSRRGLAPNAEPDHLVVASRRCRRPAGTSASLASHCARAARSVRPAPAHRRAGGHCRSFVISRPMLSPGLRLVAVRRIGRRLAVQRQRAKSECRAAPATANAAAAGRDRAASRRRSNAPAR